jgi:hypothetical protein
MSEVGTSDYIQAPSMIMTFFFLSTMKERKKERLNERKKAWMIFSLYGAKIS